MNKNHNVQLGVAKECRVPKLVLRNENFSRNCTRSNAFNVCMYNLFSFSIMESVKDTQIVADSIDDNIFQWNVKISNFDADTPLYEECEELMKKYNYDYIELQIEFSMDLYPFFPPLVKVIRPRLQGGMMLRSDFLTVQYLAKKMTI